MRDELGDRMKRNYENRTRIYLPRRTYTIVRVDGKCFGNFTKNLIRPFDMGLIEDMNETAKYLCQYIQGAKIGFVQSDEISILMTDFDTITTDAWFDGNIQKIVSVAASMATAKFNQLRQARYIKEKFDKGITNVTYRWMEVLSEQKLAEFDARTFTIPSKTEVMNYFIWRQNDCVRNSISSVAQSLYHNKKLEGKNMSMQQEMIFQKGINWNDYEPIFKRGRFVCKEKYDKDGVERTRWIIRDCPTFSQNQEFLDSFTPDLS
jgi:tRNA(His) guanylyltransferase